MPTHPESRIAFVFPGAGTVPGPAEQAWVARYVDRMLPPLRAASGVAGADLVAAVDPLRFQSLDPLARQCFTFAFGLGMADVLADQDGPPVAVAGHSLGVYAAAVAAGALSPSDGLTMLSAAYRLAVEACRGRQPAMLAISGPIDVEQAVAAMADPSMRVVIRNGAFSAVVAGPVAPVARLAQVMADEPGVRVIWLDREVAYHHPGFVAGAAKALRGVADGLEWREPRVPVVSAVDGGPCGTGSQVAAFTVANLANPIDWGRVVSTLATMGIERAWECGPGDSLARIGRGCQPELDVRTTKRWARREAG